MSKRRSLTYVLTYSVLLVCLYSCSSSDSDLPFPLEETDIFSFTEETVQEYKFGIPGMWAFPFVVEGSETFEVISSGIDPTGKADWVFCYEVTLDVFNDVQEAKAVIPGIARLNQGDCGYNFCSSTAGIAYDSSEWHEYSCGGQYRMEYTR